MSAALVLIRTVEANGGHLRVDGEYLVIAPGDAASPVMEELRRHKPEIIELLAQRPTIPSGVRLIRWEPKTAPVQVSACSTVTDVKKFIFSTLRQVEARLQDIDWRAGNWTLSTLIDRLEACGCLVELDNPRQALQ
jgi:hypothetical protein